MKWLSGIFAHGIPAVLSIFTPKFFIFTDFVITAKTIMFNDYGRLK